MTIGLNGLARDIGNDNCVVYGIAQVESTFTICKLRCLSEKEMNDPKNRGVYHLFSIIGKKHIQNVSDVIDIISFLENVFSTAESNLLPLLRESTRSARVSLGAYPMRRHDDDSPGDEGKRNIKKRPRENEKEDSGKKSKSEETKLPEIDDLVIDKEIQTVNFYL